MTSVARLSHSPGVRLGAFAMAGALLGLGFAPYAYAPASGGQTVVTSPDTVAVPGLKPFHLVGNVSWPISIGVFARINVTFVNPNEVPLTVSNLRVRKVAVAAPNATDLHPCTTADFGIRQPYRTLVVPVPAKGSTSLTGAGVPWRRWPAVRLIDRPTNQDGCLGATVTLRYTASANMRGHGGSS